MPIVVNAWGRRDDCDAEGLVEGWRMRTLAAAQSGVSMSSVPEMQSRFGCEEWHNGKLR